MDKEWDKRYVERSLSSGWKWKQWEVGGEEGHLEIGQYHGLNVLKIDPCKRLCFFDTYKYKQKKSGPFDGSNSFLSRTSLYWFVSYGHPSNLVFSFGDSYLFLSLPSTLSEGIGLRGPSPYWHYRRHYCLVSRDYQTNLSCCHTLTSLRTITLCE